MNKKFFKKCKKRILEIYNFFYKHKFLIAFLILLSAHIFFRFYQLTERANLGWDQIDSAWAAKKIIVDHILLLQGVPVKNNTGIYMGPLYYYIASIFYLFTKLDPIASPIFAGFTSILSFFVLFFVTKKIFNTKIALVALFINTFSFSIMNTDRVQNGIGWVIPVSYVIFYLLYKVLTKNDKYILLLALAVGFSFHVDFTSVFYPIIILLALPFFPKTKKTLYYCLISFPILVLFLIPSLISDLNTKSAMSNSFFTLFQTYFHGFHLRRVLQLSHDAFSGFLAIFNFNKILDYFDYLILPFFAIIYYFSNPKKERLAFIYLMSLWIIIPWFILATYRGELTNSYFSLAQNIIIAVLAYLTIYIFNKKILIFKIIPVLFWGIFAIYGIQEFRKPHPGNFLGTKSTVKESIRQNKVIPFKDKDPQSYLYYVYTRNK